MNTERSLLDIDECHDHPGCDVNAYCINAKPGYTCFCKTGYTGSGRVCQGRTSFYFSQSAANNLVTCFVVRA